MVYNWSTIIQAVLPAHCLLCGARGAQGRDICPACNGRLARNHPCCARCALPLSLEAPVGALCGRCRVRPPEYGRIVAPLRYTPPLSYLVTDLKYRGRLSAGRVLADLLADAVAAEPVPDLLVPMPLHTGRLAERGFNQATELARTTADRLGLTVAHGSLERRQATSAQAGLTRREREVNVRGAFAWRGRKAPGGRVVVIDDVVTTSSTAAAAAAALLDAGASSVDIWAVARTPPGAPG